MSWLAGFDLLAPLEPADAEALAAHCEERALPEGQVLFREGEPADGLWLVLDGEIELLRHAVAGRGRRGPGSALGALALVEAGPREATARCLSGCRLLHLSRSAFQRLVESEPRLACALALALARESAAGLREALASLPVGAS